MPPFVARKRHREPDSAPTTSPSTSRASAKKAKPTLFDALDAPDQKVRSLAESKRRLASLEDDDDDDDDQVDENADAPDSLSEAESADFEDVLPAKRRKQNPTEDDDDDDDDEEGEHEMMDWENAMQGPAPAHPEVEIGDVSISIKDDGTYYEPTVSAGTNKKGPSKRERRVRMHAHCLHVQALLWHNSVRNGWLNDAETQRSLVDGLPGGVRAEVTRWREAMGILSGDELEARKRELAAAAARGKGRKGRKKGVEKSAGRDWNVDASHLEQGVPDLSHGDPLLRLLKVLASYWRKQFTITAPGLRKQGHKSLRRLQFEVKEWQKLHDDPEEHGERIVDKKQFLKLAQDCEGSRDVGAQLFVALLRGLGIDARMVANLQPVGFGWSKAEEAGPKRPKKEIKAEESEPESGEVKVPQARQDTTKAKRDIPPEKPKRTSMRGNKGKPINLDDSDSSLTELDSEPDIKTESKADDDDSSIIDVTPSIPKKKPNKKYDYDLAFPNYWIEACSTVSNKYIPVDPIVLSTIGSNEDLIQSFEPRGKKAETAKQVMCYTIAYSSDGSAKDVTVRYLKRHQLPGKTKGVRFPVEKVPVYNRHGKVKKYEEYDWFRTIMSPYDRPEKKRTAADKLEDRIDLKPFKPSKEVKEAEKESLQWYKQSAEFVLEQHLRREEALIPGAQPVRTFVAGKGDKAKEHPVFQRKDVATCKTVESWHKEGRELKVGQQPMKLVPMRAVTLIRKREMEEALRETGEKLQQGLYSKDQTDWIIPPPIEDGVIPKNAFGNMDVYVPTMVPEGAVHLPLKGSAKLCRKLDIDYAEACTGFEFGKQRAVPVLTGVVVAEEHEMLVRDAWTANQKEIKRKEDTKRTAASLSLWRKMLLALRVLDRIKPAGADESEPFPARAGLGEKFDTGPDGHDEGLGGGGFFPPGYEEDEVPQHQRPTATQGYDAQSAGGGFFAEDDEDGEHRDDAHEDQHGGFLVEEDVVEDNAMQPTANSHVPITPISLASLHNAVEEDIVDDGVEDESVLSSDLDSLPPTPPVQDKVKSRGKAKKFKEATSPKVIIPVSSRKRTFATVKSGSQRSTPRKSQYFAAASESDQESDDMLKEGLDVDDDEEEQEVVRPRRTTARTRAKVTEKPFRYFKIWLSFDTQIPHGVGPVHRTVAAKRRTCGGHARARAFSADLSAHDLRSCEYLTLPNLTYADGFCFPHTSECHRRDLELPDRNLAFVLTFAFVQLVRDHKNRSGHCVQSDKEWDLMGFITKFFSLLLKSIH
nr:dna repair protein rhp42 [Quercus suber]